MRPSNPLTGKHFTRKEFSLKIYLLSDIVDKVLMCKTGKKDKFTEEQLKITAAVYLQVDINWAGLLLHQLKTSVLTMAQEGTPKHIFLLIINYYLHAVCPEMHIASCECATHTTLKDINLTTPRSIVKVLRVDTAPPPAPQAALEPTANHPIP